VTKQLSDILYKSGIEEVHGSTEILVTGIDLDSRLVKDGFVFVAVRGSLSDGHDYINSAIENGAVAVVCEELPADTPEGITFVKVLDSSEALGYISTNFYDHPSENLSIIGITGTNGKTTTATLLHAMFRNMGMSAGLISTVVNKINDEEIESTHTTPDAVRLNQLLHEMVQAGCSYVFMEVSSHALVQNRDRGLQFKGAVFMNITHDHLDYHGDFDAYIKAKKLLFDRLPQKAFALVNGDDRHSDIMVQNCRSRVLTFGLKTLADFKAKIIENQFSGLHLSINNNELYSKLIGGFNAYNLLAVYSVAIELGFEQLQVLTQLSLLDSVEGRFQYTKTGNGITAIVDYAHTPDALRNVLKTIHEIRTGNESVITVVGCGGDRDKAKRPVMARIGSEYSNQLLITSDNPRSEHPEAIIKDMVAGLDPVQTSRTLTIYDRLQAIKTACTIAKSGDIILVAGKGHEKYQETAGERLPFDDFQIVNETLKNLAK
jgi:UDP-N-acetylmuramoyl-L-alanyl-D-glutamate--2,6-diaminopimelate ligase